MTAGDLVVKLGLNTKNFDSNIKNSTKEIQNLKKTGKEIDSVLGKFGGTLTSLVPSLAAIGGGVAAFNETLKVNQVWSDEFGRGTDAMKAGIDSFFLSLTTGSFDGFLSGLKAVIRSAKDLYDAMDDLETFRIYEGGDMAELQAQKAAAEKIVKNANAVDSNGNRLFTEEQVRDAQAKLKEVNNTISATLKEEQKKLNTVMDGMIGKVQSLTGAYTNEIADMLTKYGTAEKAQERMNELAEKYRTTVNGSQSVGNFGYTVSTTSFNWSDNKAKEEYEALGKLIALASDGDDVLGAYNKQRKEYAAITQEIIRQETEEIRLNSRANRSVAKSKGSTTSKPTFSPDMLGMGYYFGLGGENNEIVDVDIIQEGLESEIDLANEEQEINNLIAEGNKQLQQRLTNLEAIGELGNSIGNIFGNIGNIIEGTAGNIVSWIGSTISSLAELYSKYAAIAVANAGTLPFPTNLVAIASTVGAITAAIASFPKFANGGIVGGNSFSGDKILAGLNSGEMVLNRGQQANLFSMLSNGTGSNKVEFVIKGQELHGVLSNYNSKFNRIR